jgi:hypothetical protein
VGRWGEGIVVDRENQTVRPEGLQYQILSGPFSAVLTPIFATKYYFFSVFRDLQLSHTFAPL